MEAPTIEPRASDEGHEELVADKRQRELREAIDRVYRKYGTNLTAFFRDAHREAQRESEKKMR